MTLPAQKFRTIWGGAFLSYIKTLSKAMPQRVALALTLMILIALTEGIGILLLVPLLHLVGLDVDEGSLGEISGHISSAFAVLGVVPDLPQVLVFYVAVVGIRSLLSRWQTVTSIRIQQIFVADLRHQLYAAIATANWLFLSRCRSSDFVHLLTVEIDRVGMGTYHLLYLAVSLAVTLVYIIFAFQISAVTTALVVLCGAALTLLVRGKMTAARSDGREISSTTSRLYASALQDMDGLKTVKSYGAEERTIELFATRGEGVSQRYIRAISNYADVRSIFEISSVLVLSFILYVSIEYLEISTASLFILLLLFVRIIPRFSSVQQSYLQFVGLLPSFVSLRETLSRLEAATEVGPDRDEEVDLSDGICLEEVSFSYGEGRPPAVDGLSMKIPAGETVAILGASGAGKSTAADLLMGLIVPDSGRILIDGVLLTPARIRGWRSKIGYVTQETFLFNDTLRANLLWARPTANDLDIQEALKLAAADGFVSDLPSKMETLLGDRGARLSGGERQRIALARALLRRPSLLILDEATSNLDPENERRIQRAVEELHGTLTIVIITHRISAIRGSDRIYVLEKGRLIESGGWDELLAKDGRFTSLVRAQGIVPPSWTPPH
jgi:ATP-binding cassette subfamily C protein